MQRNLYFILAFFFGLVIANIEFTTVQAQAGPSTQFGDALWHLPQFGETGWFLHASNGRVRACNMDKVSVVGARPGPRCSNWE